MPRFVMPLLLIVALTATAASQDPVTAIDNLLEPDAAMLHHAQG
jgi:hypothetical protein